jgi:class 3 adenylate cyclase
MQSLFEFKKRINDEKILRSKDQEIAQSQIQKQKIMRNSLLVSATLLLMLLFGLYKRYSFKQKANLKLEQKNKIILHEKQRSEELLLNILPTEVADELKANGKAEAKFFDNATVMFTDFKDFTKISEKLSPSELVSEIDTCFRAFDEIITKNNIEKIKTIGDAYMCVGGLPVTNNTHAYDVVNAAKQIQSFMELYIKERIKDGKEPFHIRIGIHSGPVVAGIVGSKKFAYDIWGDTVNVAARMESSGQEGKINISGSTCNLVKEMFNCVYRGKIQAKNKGEIDMYFVES